VKAAAIFIATLLVASSAVAENWGKAVMVDRTGLGRSDPESSQLNGVTYETLSDEEAEAMTQLLSALKNQPGGPSIPDTERFAIFTGIFPAPTGNGYQKKDSLPFGELKKKLAGCTFGPIQSLGHTGSMAFGMVKFRCPSEATEWKEGAIGLSLAANNIDFAVNNGDLSNMLFTDKKATK